MRFGFGCVFIFGIFFVFCDTSGVLSQFWRNLFTVISGKLTVKNYLKQNDFDYSNPCNLRKYLAKNVIISKTNTIHLPEKTLRVCIEVNIPAS